MAKPLSPDLRIRIIRAVEDQGMSCRGAASRFGVSPSGKGNVSKVLEGVYRGSFPTPSQVQSRSAHAS